MRIKPSKRILVIVAAATVLAGSGVAAAAVASAEESAPSIEELLRDCNTKTDLCKFTITKHRETLGNLHQVSAMMYNCSPDDQTYERDWTDTTTNTIKAGIEIGMEGGFAEVFKASWKATFGYEWQSSKQVTDKAPIKIRSGWVGWIDRATSLDETTGDYELHYGSRKNGHYYWFIRNAQIVSPTRDDKSNLVAQSRPMTGDERAACPGGGPKAAARGTVEERGRHTVESVPIR